MVAHINRLPQNQLEDFLFGIDRVSSRKIREGRWEIQGKDCFYCRERILEPRQEDVDHFLPWAQYPDNGMDNLVVAHKRCNNKRDFLAAARHVERWSYRFHSNPSGSTDLSILAESMEWERDPDKTRGAARALYLRLHDDAKLWSEGKRFVSPDFPLLQESLCG